MKDRCARFARFGRFTGIFTEDKISTDDIKDEISACIEQLKFSGITNITADDLFFTIMKYEIRSDDNGRGDPCTIEQSVIVNSLGAFLSTDMIEFGSDGYIDISDDYEFSEEISINTWLLMEAITLEFSKFIKSQTINFPDCYITEEEISSNYTIIDIDYTRDNWSNTIKPIDVLPRNISSNSINTTSSLSSISIPKEYRSCRFCQGCEINKFLANNIESPYLGTCLISKQDVLKNSNICDKFIPNYSAMTTHMLTYGQK